MNVNLINNSYTTPQFKGKFVDTKVLQDALKAAPDKELARFGKVLKHINNAKDELVLSLEKSSRNHINLNAKTKGLTEIGRVLPDTLAEGYVKKLSEDLTDTLFFKYGSSLKMQVFNSEKGVMQDAVLIYNEVPACGFEAEDSSYFSLHVKPVVRGSDDTKEMPNILSALIKNIEEKYYKGASQYSLNSKEIFMTREESLETINNLLVK